MNLIDSMTKNLKQNRLPIKKRIPQPPISVKLKCQECPICYGELNADTNIITTICNHQFCSKCLLKGLNHKNTCPICRTELKPKYSDKFDIREDELRIIVFRTISTMPDRWLNKFKITNKILSLLQSTKIPDIFENDINVLDELEYIEEDLLTAIAYFGHSIANDLFQEVIDRNS